jgi:hypothetical protein
VRLWKKVPSVLFAVALAAWQGLAVSIPHNHADIHLPQEEIACSVSHPLSGEFHLHGAGEILTPHTCFACLTGSIVGFAPVRTTIDAVFSKNFETAVAVPGCRKHNRFHLPFHRGPPIRV